MCGIVGYIGNGSAKEVIINGLKSLEYRGYDSAGIALAKDNKILLKKEKGEIVNLESKIKADSFDGSVGIGHTRWATHGVPSKDNAHPHTSADKKIAVVHNGIIENYQELKAMLKKDYGIEFYSETDTEVIAKLIGVYYKGDLLEAVKNAVDKMEGAYAIGVIGSDEPDKIIAVRKDAPLIAGIGDGCNYIASDIPALLKYTKDTYLIENNEIVVLTKDNIRIIDENGKDIKDREVFHVTWDSEAAEKGGYDHFMLKEIYEQPAGVKETLSRRLDKKGNIKLDGIKLSKEDIDNIDRIYIVACGTAYHAGLVGKAAIEHFAKIPVEVDLASEFRYRNPYVDDRTLCICVSQSGETLDTLEALREAKKNGARILSVVNVVGSSIDRESDDVFYTWAGPEIAVASTKAFTTQLVCMYLIALYMGITNGKLSKKEYENSINELKQVPDKIREILKNEKAIAKTAEYVSKHTHPFFIGRGLDVSIAYEGSLKLKEISYINSFAIAAGELKHGTIALVTKNTPFVVLATQDKLYEKMVSNIEEIKARGAYVIALTKEGNERIEEVSDETIYIPKCSDELSPLLTVIPLQVLAYHVAKIKGKSIDKPRNLAKSVTVE